MAKKEKASKNGPPPTEGPSLPSTWQHFQIDLGHYKPWEVGQHDTAEVFRMYAQEAKACFYDVLRDHVELFYNATGWPANHKEWEPLVKERDALFRTDEQAPDSEGIGVRYGLTYAAQRWAYDEVQRDGWRIPLSSGPFTAKEEFARYWVRMWLVHYLHEVVRPFLVRHKYTEAMGIELRAAFADFGTFEVGKGIGASVWSKLMSDEQGCIAIATFQNNRGLFTDELYRLLAEPFGIDRDFKHLLDTAGWAFGLVLLEKYDPFIGDQLKQLLHRFKLHDTFGMEPAALYNEATMVSGGAFQLSVWVPLYLKRVKAIGHRWIDNDQHKRVDECLIKLTRELKALDPVPGYGTPKDRTDIETATREIAEGIEELRGKVTTGSTIKKPDQKAAPRTLAERLDAKPGAREAFDTMLLIDGFTNESGQCTLESRKGKGGILAAWDAVVDRFGVEGYQNGLKGDEALSIALMNYMPPLRIQKRVCKLRGEGNLYSKALKSCNEYLTEREKRNVRERSDRSE